MIARVRGVIAASIASRSRSNPCARSASTRTGVAPAATIKVS